MLIHPPVAKASEPPPGLAALAGALGPTVPLIDANLQGLYHLLSHNLPDDKPQAQRVWRQRLDHWAALKQMASYRSVDHYNRLVTELERVLSAGHRPTKIGLADYLDPHASPVRSADLLREAETPERNAFFNYYNDVLLPAIEKAAPAWIGLSVNFMSQALPAFALIGMLKERWPMLPVVIGGGLITSWMALDSWNNPFSGLVDHLIPGAGEAALAQWTGFTGHLNAPPDYSQLSTADYLSPVSVLPYAASRGCLWHRCRFCPEVAEAIAYRPHAISKARTDLQQLIASHRPGLLHLVDSALSMRLVDSFVTSPLPVPWYGYLRFEDRLLDIDFCRALEASGCAMIKLGLESGSQRVLDALDKGIVVQKAGQILNNLKAAGIHTFVYVLFGTPPETETEALETLAFVEKHSEAITYLNTALFLLPRHSPLAATVETADFSAGDLSLYTGFTHPADWSRRALRHFVDRTWKRHPAVAPILRRTPRVFTSNHAPFFKNARF